MTAVITPSVPATTDEEIKDQAASAAASEQAKADAATAKVNADLKAEQDRKAATAKVNEAYLVAQTAKAIEHLTTADGKDREAAAISITAAAERLAVCTIIVDLADRLWMSGETDSQGRPKWSKDGRKAYLAWAEAKRPNGLGIGRTQADQMYSAGRFLPSVPKNLRNRFVSLEAVQDARAVANTHGTDVLVDALKVLPKGSTGQAVRTTGAMVVEARETEAFNNLTKNEQTKAKAAVTRAANKATKEQATKAEQDLVDLFATKYGDSVKATAEIAKKDPMQAAHYFAACMLDLIDPHAASALRTCQSTAQAIKDLTS